MPAFGRLDQDLLAFDAAQHTFPVLLTLRRARALRFSPSVPEPLEIRRLRQLALYARGTDLEGVVLAGNNVFGIQDVPDLLRDDLAIAVGDAFRLDRCRCAVIAACRRQAIRPRRSRGLGTAATRSTIAVICSISASRPVCAIFQPATQFRFDANKKVRFRAPDSSTNLIVSQTAYVRIRARKYRPKSEKTASGAHAAIMAGN